MSNHATVLLNNVKEIIDKMQLEKAYFKLLVEKLKNEKKQLVILNKSLTNKVDILEKDLQRKNSL